MSSFISVTCVTCCFPFQYEPTAATMLLFRNRSPPPHSRLVSLTKSGVILHLEHDAVRAVRAVPDVHALHLALVQQDGDVAELA